MEQKQEESEQVIVQNNNFFIEFVLPLLVENQTKATKTKNPFVSLGFNVKLHNGRNAAVNMSLVRDNLRFSYNTNSKSTGVESATYARYEKDWSADLKNQF